MHMDVLAVFLIVSGVGLLVVSGAMAVVLVRPPQSPRGRRWLTLPWANENLPAEQKRRKQALYIVGMCAYGVMAVLQGAIRASKYQNRFLEWLLILVMAVGLVCLLASLAISQRTR